MPCGRMHKAGLLDGLEKVVWRVAVHQRGLYGSLVQRSFAHPRMKIQSHQSEALLMSNDAIKRLAKELSIKEIGDDDSVLEGPSPGT